MRNASFNSLSSHLNRNPALEGVIEWEELPSLAVRFAGRVAGFSEALAWDETRPAELTVTSSLPFREPLHGVAVREVMEPDVFRHFFS